MKIKKRPRALVFRVTREYFNEFIHKMVLRSYKVLPRDIELYSIDTDPNYYNNSYIIIIKSKKFPIVEEGSRPHVGYVKYDKLTKTMTLKQVLIT